MSEKSIGDGSLQKSYKNPLLSSAVTGLSFEDLTNKAVILPVIQPVVPQGTQDSQAQPSRDRQTQPLRNESDPRQSSKNTPFEQQFSSACVINTDNTSQTKSNENDDFDVNEYFARLQGTRYVSAPMNSDINANLESKDDSLEEINLLEDPKLRVDDSKNSLTADIAHNFSQLPTVLPQVANAVFSSFSYMLSAKPRAPTPNNNQDDIQSVYPSQPEQPTNTGIYGNVLESSNALVEPVPMFDTDDKMELKHLGPPPKGQVQYGNTFRIASKKKAYAQVPGLQSGQPNNYNVTQQPMAPSNMNVQLNPQQFLPLSTYEQNAPTAFQKSFNEYSDTPVLSSSQLTNTDQQFEAAADLNYSQIQGTAEQSILMSTYPTMESEIPKDHVIVDNQTTADISSRLDNPQSQLNQASTMPAHNQSVAACPIGPPPTTFFGAKKNSGTVYSSLLPPSVARRMSASHVKQAFDTYPKPNIFVPEINSGTLYPGQQSVGTETSCPLPISKPYIDLKSAEQVEIQIINVKTEDDSKPADEQLDRNSGLHLANEIMFPQDAVISDPKICSQDFSNKQMDGSPQGISSSLEPKPTSQQPTSYSYKNNISLPNFTTSSIADKTTPSQIIPLPTKIKTDQSFRMTKKRPQYYAGPIEGVGVIESQVKTATEPLLSVGSNETQKYSLFTPNLNITQSSNQIEYSDIYDSRASQPFDITENQITYGSDTVTLDHLSQNPNKQSTELINEDQRPSQLFGTLKSTLGSLNIEKLHTKVATFFDPGFYEESTNSEDYQSQNPSYSNYENKYGLQKQVVISPQGGDQMSQCPPYQASNMYTTQKDMNVPFPHNPKDIVNLQILVPEKDTVVTPPSDNLTNEEFDSFHKVFSLSSNDKEYIKSLSDTSVLQSDNLALNYAIPNYDEDDRHHFDHPQHLEIDDYIKSQSNNNDEADSSFHKTFETTPNLQDPRNENNSCGLQQHISNNELISSKENVSAKFDTIGFLTDKNRVDSEKPASSLQQYENIDPSQFFSNIADNSHSFGASNTSFFSDDYKNLKTTTNDDVSSKPVVDALPDVLKTEIASSEHLLTKKDERKSDAVLLSEKTSGPNVDEVKQPTTSDVKHKKKKGKSDLDSDVTSQMIENMTSPFQLFNPVEKPLIEQSPIQPPIRIPTDSTVHKSELTVHKTSLDEYLQNQIYSNLYYQGPDSQSFLELSCDSPLDNICATISTNVNPIGQQANVNDESNIWGMVKPEEESKDNVFSRQMSIPSAPSIELLETSESVEKGDSGTIDVNLIEQDAKKDFYFAEFIIEPSQSENLSNDAPINELILSNKTTAVSPLHDHSNIIQPGHLFNITDENVSTSSFYTPQVISSSDVKLIPCFDTEKNTEDNYYKNSSCFNPFKSPSVEITAKEVAASAISCVLSSNDTENIEIIEGETYTNEEPKTNIVSKSQRNGGDSNEAEDDLNVIKLIPKGESETSALALNKSKFKVYASKSDDEVSSAPIENISSSIFEKNKFDSDELQQSDKNKQESLLVRNLNEYQHSRQTSSVTSLPDPMNFFSDSTSFRFENPPNEGNVNPLASYFRSPSPESIKCPAEREGPPKPFFELCQGQNHFKFDAGGQPTVSHSVDKSQTPQSLASTILEPYINLTSDEACGDRIDILNNFSVYFCATELDGIADIDQPVSKNNSEVFEVACHNGTQETIINHDNNLIADGKLPNVSPVSNNLLGTYEWEPNVYNDPNSKCIPTIEDLGEVSSEWEPNVYNVPSSKCIPTIEDLGEVSSFSDFDHNIRGGESLELKLNFCDKGLKSNEIHSTPKKLNIDSKSELQIIYDVCNCKHCCKNNAKRCTTVTFFSTKCFAPFCLSDNRKTLTKVAEDTNKSENIDSDVKSDMSNGEQRKSQDTTNNTEYSNRRKEGVSFGEVQEGIVDDKDSASIQESPHNEYASVKHHWFYRHDFEGKSIWRPFSHKDSCNLENAFNDPNLSEATVVPTNGGRYDVKLVQRLRYPVYWIEEPTKVQRCSWFYKAATDVRYIPYNEDTCERLEEEYRRGMVTGEWHRRLTLDHGESVMLHGPTAIVHFLPGSGPDTWSSGPQFLFGKRVYRSVKLKLPIDDPDKIDHLLLVVHGAGENREQRLKLSSMRPRVVVRGAEEHDVVEDIEPSKVDHLLLLCHGIGSACDLKFRAVEEVVDDFRASAVQLLKSHYKKSFEEGLIGRVEVLPISWHKSLHSGELGVDERMARVTLESIPKFRAFTNDTVLDVLFYTSPVFCQTIMDTVGHELNRIYSVFMQRNPGYTGGVSLGGHSLGSLILYDILCHQQPIEKRKVLLGPAGTGQPFIRYPKLDFHPDALFALGSPIAIFECIRGVDSLGEDFALPTCPAFFNIFHPYDPVAYRVEPLINAEWRSIPPMLIPHHKGRKRMHLELKDTMTRVGADLKQRVFDGLRNTWYNMFSNRPEQVDRRDQVLVEEDEPVESDPPLNPSASSFEYRQRSEYDSSSYGSEGAESSGSQTGGQDRGQVTCGQLNKGRRVDMVLQEAPFEIFNEYLFAMTSHVCYWDSEDTILLILREIYGNKGVTADCTVPQQTLTVERDTMPPTAGQESRGEGPSTSRLNP